MPKKYWLRWACGLLAVAGMANMLPASAADALDSKGREFWVGFPQNYQGGGETTFSLFISGDQAAAVTVAVPGLGFSQNLTITPGVASAIVLPVGVEVTEAETAVDKGIHVTSDNEVTVYGLSRQQYTTDAYLGLPQDVIGTDYIVLAYGGYSSSLMSQFLVVATADNTQITVTPSTGDLCPGSASFTLNKGQAFRHRSCSGGDVSGTLISSSAPVAIYGGHECANIPNSETAACDHVLEQMPPTTAWGKHFLTVPLKSRANGDTFRILAGTDGTKVSIDGVEVATLNKGEFHQQLILAASNIETSQPALVAQYSNGTTFDGVTSDPFMMLIPPYEQYLDRYTFAAPTEGFAENFVNVIVRTGDAAMLRLDSTAIPAASFTPIGTSGFSGAQLDIAPGSHTLSGAVAGAFVYGFDQADSYGYPGGLSLSEIARASSLALAPTTASEPLGASHCVTATVLDQASKPLASIRVDVAVTGVNPNSGNALTDVNGHAQYCWTGTVAGTDNVVATVGTLTANASVTWANNPPTVNLAVNPQTITLGQSATLTWSSTDATACTASGAWSGSEPISGSLTVTPTAAGTPTYTLSCTGGGGTTAASRTLRVNAPPLPPLSVTTGGGAAGPGMLGLLGALAWMRRARRRGHLAALALVCVLAAPAAQALTLDNVILGVRVGHADSNLGGGTLTADLRSRGYNVRAGTASGGIGETAYIGYAPIPHLDVLLSYTHSDDAKVTITGTTPPNVPKLLQDTAGLANGYSGDVYALSTRLHGDILPGLSLGPRVGVFLISSRTAMTSGATHLDQTHDRGGITMGVGLQYRIWRGLHVGAGADYYRAAGDRHFVLAGGEMEWRFGGQ